MSGPGKQRGHRKAITAELRDMDYIKKLSPEDAAWLYRFTQEYYFNTFNDKPLTPKEERKAYYARDNARRRDIWSHSYRDPSDLADTRNNDGEDDDE